MKFSWRSSFHFSVWRVCTCQEPNENEATKWKKGTNSTPKKVWVKVKHLYFPCAFHMIQALQTTRQQLKWKTKKQQKIYMINANFYLVKIIINGRKIGNKRIWTTAIINSCINLCSFSNAIRTTIFTIYFHLFWLQYINSTITILDPFTPKANNNNNKIIKLCKANGESIPNICASFMFVYASSQVANK